MSGGEADPLYSLAEIVRGKNAGPFLFTVDVFFRERDDYLRVKESNFIDASRVAATYGVEEDAVCGIYFWDPALALKITVSRRVSAGAVGDDDCYGANQHVPLMMLRIPAADARGA